MQLITNCVRFLKEREVGFRQVYNMAKSRITQYSSKSKQAPPSKRFDFEIVDDFQELSRGFVPLNTAADMHKCVHLFQEWTKERNLHFKEDEVPEDILVTDDHQSLCHWLCKFCSEICKLDGIHYSPRSIWHYLMGIQRHIRASKPGQITFSTTMISVLLGS